MCEWFFFFIFISVAYFSQLCALNCDVEPSNYPPYHVKNARCCDFAQGGETHCVVNAAPYQPSRIGRANSFREMPYILAYRSHLRRSTPAVCCSLFRRRSFAIFFQFVPETKSARRLFLLGRSWIAWGCGGAGRWVFFCVLEAWWPVTRNGHHKSSLGCIPPRLTSKWRDQAMTKAAAAGEAAASAGLYHVQLKEPPPRPFHQTSSSWAQQH